MKSNPLTRYTAREIHDEFYQPELLKAEADTPPEIRVNPRRQTGKSTKPYQPVDAPLNGNNGQIRRKQNR